MLSAYSFHPVHLVNLGLILLHMRSKFFIASLAGDNLYSPARLSSMTISKSIFNLASHALHASVFS
jgi:hypothetical protein